VRSPCRTNIIAFMSTDIAVADLLSFHHPRDDRSSSGTYRKSRRDSQRRVPLEATSCVVQECFGGVKTLLRGVPHYSQAIFDRIGNRTCCTSSLVS
jgi:hypothetical protein